MLSEEQLAEIRDDAQSLLSGVGSLPCEQDHGRDILALLDEHAAFKAALADIADECIVGLEEHASCYWCGNNMASGHVHVCPTVKAAETLGLTVQTEESVDAARAKLDGGEDA